jgi:hypothetical protein
MIGIMVAKTINGNNAMMTLVSNETESPAPIGNVGNVIPPRSPSNMKKAQISVGT